MEFLQVINSAVKLHFYFIYLFIFQWPPRNQSSGWKKTAVSGKSFLHEFLSL